MLGVWAALRSRYSDAEAGASMVEYAFLIGLIAIVVVASALFLGTELNDKFSEVGDTMANL